MRFFGVTDLYRLYITESKLSLRRDVMLSALFWDNVQDFRVSVWMETIEIKMMIVIAMQWWTADERWL